MIFSGYRKAAPRLLVAIVATALPLGAVWAQLQPKENQPGGVEAMPTPKTQGVMPGAPARAVPPPPAPAGAPVRAPALATGSKPVAPVAPDTTKAKDDGKSTGSKKSKKSMKKSSEPADGSNLPRAPSTSPGNAPAIPGDETQPGGVERAPTVPQPKR